MKRKSIIILSAILLFTAHLAYSQSSNYKVINEEGIGNIVFATQAISKGEENSADLKEEFKEGESVYARCFFPKTIAQYNIKTTDPIIIEAFVNKRAIDRAYIKPKMDWDQMQIYVFNTDDDDFSRLSGELNYLESGENIITISVGLQVFSHKEKVLNDDGVIVEEDVDKIIYLSKGEFKILVE